MGQGLTAAARLRPRPQLVVVLTDGYTPWPKDAPRFRVIVGLIGPWEGEAPPAPPAWARTVRIGEAA